MKLRTYSILLRLIIFTAVVFLFSPDSHAESLYVFIPSKLRPVVMQEKLLQACPGIDIMVFGRHKDFANQVKANSPDAILTKIPVIENIGGYAVCLKGGRGGSADELYILLSVNKKVEPANIGKLKIGVFDILGRKKMKTFIGKFFNPVPKLKRVSKMEDLLQLLTFNMADAVLTPENTAPYFKEISNLNFVTTPVPDMKTEIVSLAQKDGTAASKTIEAIKKMDAKTMALLEVDTWK